MNSMQIATVFLATVGLFVTARLPGGGLNSTNLFNCQPIDRLWVKPGAICFQQNTTMQSCRNQTCRCTAKPLHITPTLRPGTGNSTSNSTNSTTTTTTTARPFKLPTFPPIPRWNCTVVSNSTAPSTNSSTTLEKAEKMAKVFVVLAIAVAVLALAVDAQYGGRGNGTNTGSSGGYGGSGNTNGGTGAGTNAVKSGAPCTDGGSWAKDANADQCVCAKAQRAKRHYNNYYYSGSRYGSGSGSNSGGSGTSGYNGYNGGTDGCPESAGNDGFGNSGNGGDGTGSEGGGIVPVDNGSGTGSTA
ncbi:hypothetical protein Ocin01_06141 [Orchesella cincta]|uniref:Uncharacterized protein n=1 Tax=Orchesella cincta TaxID=48709 RepID=A0A1D2N5P9_ORCCI|nr:hypothetical protein Ocin01_06141 [Orchesella cincta]